LRRWLRDLKGQDGPILLHVLTEKGHGVPQAAMEELRAKAHAKLRSCGKVCRQRNCLCAQQAKRAIGLVRVLRAKCALLQMRGKLVAFRGR
jgi:deoxyxylulose-5-phosphate synthase